ncbi:MAG: hypothetical protein ACYC8T_04635 [Myxococcaceae bacterium]
MLKKIFLIPFGLWLVVTLAWFLGAGGVSFRTQYGGDANIDFNRKYDRQVRQVAPSVGYVVESGGNGPLVRLESGPPPFCWLCGANTRDGGLLQSASHRDGAWIYQAPAPDPNFTGWTNQKGIELALVLAYQTVTGEKLAAPRGSSVEAKRALLEAKGLVADEAHRLTPEALSAWQPVSMMREGCVIVQAAFLIFIALWSLGWGAGLLVVRVRGRSKRS